MATEDRAARALHPGVPGPGLKGFSEFFRTGHWNLRRFVETGGMPSSHAASVAALSTEVAFHEGVRTVLFGVTLYFSLVVMYDAAVCVAPRAPSRS
jgi:acid phosphatase family membrane protein YuiD